MRISVLVLLGVAACGGPGGVPSDAQKDSAVSPDPDALIDAMVDAPGTIIDSPFDAAIDAAVDAPTDAPIDAALVDAPPDAAVINGVAPTGTCKNDWCWVLPMPQGNQLNAVAGTTATDVWVVGEFGPVVHYDGGSWTTHIVGTGSHRYVWARSSTDVWVTGTNGLWRWNGTVWTQIESGTHVAMNGIGATELWAFRLTGVNTGYVVRWDGTTKTTLPQPAADFVPIAFFGPPGATWAASVDGRFAKWLGTTWGVTSSSNIHGFKAAAVIDDTHIVFAETNAVQFWDGTGFSTRPGLPATAMWDTVAARSFTDVWACANICYHWDGVAWTQLSADPSGIWIEPSGALWEVQQSSVIRVWNGAWTPKSIGSSNLRFTAGTADNDIWALGAGLGIAEHWNGSAWTTVSFPFGLYSIGDMWGSGPNDYWVAAGHRVGANGTWCPYGGPGCARVDLHMIHWDGTSWTTAGPIGSFPTLDGYVDHGFMAVWGSGPNDVYAVSGLNQDLRHFNGTTWSAIPGQGGTDVFGSGPNDVYVAAGTTLRRWNGTTWTSLTPTISVQRGWANSPTDVWLNGTSSSLHYDGTFFVALGGTGIFFGSATKMFRAGAFDVQEWPTGFGGATTTVPKLFEEIGNGWIAPSGRAYLAGKGLIVNP